jgi:hypothetical protein
MPDFPHPKPSVSMADLLKSRVVPVKKSRGMGERQELICSVCDAVGIGENYLQSVYFSSRLLTDNELKDIRDKACAFKANPPAYFWKLLKGKKAEILSKLNSGV